MKRNKKDLPPVNDPRLALEGFLKGKSFTEILLEVKDILPVCSPTRWEECVSGPQQDTNKKE